MATVVVISQKDSQADIMTLPEEKTIQFMKQSFQIKQIKSEHVHPSWISKDIATCNTMTQVYMGSKIQTARGSSEKLFTCF